MSGLFVFKGVSLLPSPA